MVAAVGSSLVVRWLPDGLFSFQKSEFGYILEGLGMENVGLFRDHLEYFTSVWYTLWLFGIVWVHLIIFSQFWYVCTNKNLATRPFRREPAFRIWPVELCSQTSLTVQTTNESASYKVLALPAPLCRVGRQC
jgi:hypothetical protein